MSVIQGLFQRERKRSLGVCIPDTSRHRAMEEELKRKKMVRHELNSGRAAEAHSAFEVTGVFQVYDTLMLQGSVLEGAISKKSSAVFKGVKLKVAELRTADRAEEFLGEEDKGAVFLKAEKGKFPLIRTGDVIEF